MFGFAGDGGPPAAALLNFQMANDNPEPGGGLAIDDQDRLYIVDTENHRIRRVDFAADIIETVAGNGTPGFSGDGGPATEASLAWPRDAAIGPDGRLYIADTDNHRVRVVDLATGIITTVAGNGVAALRGRRRPADRRVAAAPVGDRLRRRRQPLHRRHAQQPDPEGDAVTAAGRRSRAWLAAAALGGAAAAVGCGDDEQMPPVPIACNPAPGNICTVAGTGIAGDGADGLAALATRLYLPQDVTIGPDGRLYIVDWNNHRIRARQRRRHAANRRRHRRAGAGVGRPVHGTAQPPDPGDVRRRRASGHRRLAQQPDQDDGRRDRRAARRLRHGQTRLRRRRRPRRDRGAGPARRGGVRSRGQHADRRPGEQSNPQGRRGHADDQHVRRRRQVPGPRRVPRARRRRPRDRRVHLAAAGTVGAAGRADRRRRRGQRLHRRHAQQPRPQDRHGRP